MNEFLRVAYGDPCRECGFEWSVKPAICLAIVSDAPARFKSIPTGQDGRRSLPGLQWNAVAYVAHVADVLRIWSDRIAASALGASNPSARRISSSDELDLNRSPRFRKFSTRY
jgi:hypothetical protein